MSLFANSEYLVSHDTCNYNIAENYILKNCDFFKVSIPHWDEYESDDLAFDLESNQTLLLHNLCDVLEVLEKEESDALEKEEIVCLPSQYCLSKAKLDKDLDCDTFCVYENNDIASFNMTEGFLILYTSFHKYVDVVTPTFLKASDCLFFNDKNIIHLFSQTCSSLLHVDGFSNEVFPIGVSDKNLLDQYRTILFAKIINCNLEKEFNFYKLLYLFCQNYVLLNLEDLFTIDNTLYSVIVKDEIFLCLQDLLNFDCEFIGMSSTDWCRCKNIKRKFDVKVDKFYKYIRDMHFLKSTETLLFDYDPDKYLSSGSVYNVLYYFEKFYTLLKKINHINHNSLYLKLLHSTDVKDKVKLQYISNMLLIQRKLYNLFNFVGVSDIMFFDFLSDTDLDTVEKICRMIKNRKSCD